MTIFKNESKIFCINSFFPIEKFRLTDKIEFRKRILIMIKNNFRSFVVLVIFIDMNRSNDRNETD